MARTYPLNIVGREVAKIRTNRTLSQTEVATACQLDGWDISRDTIAKIEGGTRWVGDQELIHLARALKVPLSDLYPDAPIYKSCF